MKKNIWSKLIIPTLGLLILSGVGISTFKTSEPAETKAASSNSLVGSMNGWNLSDRNFPLEDKGNNIHEGVFLFDAGVEFKVNKGNGTGWSGQDKGWVKVLDIGSRKDGTVSDSGGNIKVNAKYRFRIQFNYTTEDITIDIYRQPGRTAGINKDYMRLFVYRGSYEVDGALNCIQYGSSIDGGTLIIEPSGYVQNITTGIWYAYFDVPINDFVNGTTKICVARVSANRGKIWNSTSQITWTTGDNNYVLFVADNWGHTLTKGILSDAVGSVNVGFLKVVLEGYLTCSPSTVNGYGAFNQMNKTFFVHADGVTWKTEGSLGSISLSDYAEGDTNYSGGKTRTTTGWDKYSKMKSMYETGGAGATTIVPPSDSSSSNTAAAIVISVLFSFTVIGGLYFAKKRKKQLA